jgi:peptidoglycan/xylan/chitin deacetylase (PgdA/CDA1 family)
MHEAVRTAIDRRAVPIITYHSIDTSGSVVSTTPEVFRKQITRLRESGYSSMTVGRFTDTVRSGQWPSEKTVILTFDDGFENFLTDAAPILDEHSFTATVYLVTDQCGRFNDWAGNPPGLPRSSLLSWDQVKQLSSSGFEFGSHTATHPDLTAIDPSSRDAELSRSKIAIEDAIGKKVKSFAYPFGRATGAVQRSVEKVYGSATSTNLGKVTGRSDMYSLERIDAYYLSNPRSLERLETHWMDTYLAIRQALRTVKAAVA